MIKHQLVSVAAIATSYCIYRKLMHHALLIVYMQYNMVAPETFENAYHTEIIANMKDYVPYTAWELGLTILAFLE